MIFIQWIIAILLLSFAMVFAAAGGMLVEYPKHANTHGHLAVAMAFLLSLVAIVIPHV
jgi:hypothetical protein